MSSKKGKSTGKAPAAPKLTWSEFVDTIDLNQYHEKRKCNIFFISESKESLCPQVDALEEAANEEFSDVIKTLSYDNIHELCQQFLQEEPPPFQHQEYFQEAANEIKEFIAINNYFPARFVPKLIKLSIAYIIDVDVRKSEMVALEELKRTGEIKELLKEAEEKLGDKKGKKKGKKEKKKKDKKKKKGGGESEKDICSEITLTGIKSEVIKSIVTIPEKRLYICLLHFYDVYICSELITLNLPIESIVMVIDKNDQNVVDKVAKYKVKLDMDFVTEYCANRIASELQVQHAFDENEDGLKLPRAYLLNKFKQDLGDIVNFNEFNNFRNIYISKFFPIDVRFVQECLKSIYERWLSFFNTIQNIRRKYERYSEHLLLTKLGNLPNVRPAKCLRYYTNELDNIPPELCSSGICLIGLFDEVNKKLGYNSKIEGKSSGNLRESVELEEYTKEKPKYKDSNSCDWHFHRCIRDEVVNMFVKQRNRHKICEKDDSSQQWRTMIYSPAMKYKVQCNPFVAHERNFIEIATNGYRKIRDTLFNKNMDILKHIRPALLWNKTEKVCELEQLIYKHQQLVWKNKLRLTENELLDGICIYFLTHIILRGPPDEENSSRNFTALFYKTRELLNPILFDSTRCTADLINLPLYETVHFGTLKFKETMSPIVFLQDIQEALNDFAAMEWFYAANIDSIILFFHDNCDFFGITRKLQTIPLRAPICLRDFCRYVIHAEQKWVQEEDSNYLLEQQRERQLNLMKKRQDFIRMWDKPETGIYMLKNVNYTLPKSIKDDYERCQRELAEGTGAEGKGKGKKGKKGKKEKPAKASKRSSIKTTETKLEGVEEEKIENIEILPPSTIQDIQVDNIGSHTIPIIPIPEKLDDFVAYDIGENQHIQYILSNTIFKSLDGVKITLDQSYWQGIPPLTKFFSIEIEAIDNILMLHPNVDTKLSFHFILKNGIIVAFGKSSHETNSSRKLVENRYQLKERPPCPKEKTYYHLKEKCQITLGCLQVPYNMQKRSFVLPAKEWDSFCSKPCSSLSIIYFHEKSKEHCFTNTINTAISMYSRQSTESVPFGVIPQDRPSEEKMPTSETDKEAFKKALKKALKKKTPIFKICSSKYNRSNYIVRKKDHVNVEIGGVVKKVNFRANFKPKKLLEIKQIFPIGCEDLNTHKETAYDIQITLPSGLVISSEPGIENKPFHIKQSYLLKGPQCKPIEEEEWRVMLRNGSIFIKKLDGTVLVYTINGTIISYEVPFFDSYKDIKLKYNIPNKPVESFKKTRIKRLYKQAMQRRIKHIIHGPEEYYHRSRKQFLRFQKKKLKKNCIYLATNEDESIYPKYSVIMSDGKQVKIVKGRISEEKAMFMSKDSDVLKGEEIFEREDGTQCLFENEGANIVQFPDGTRIKSWFCIGGTVPSMDSDVEQDMEEDDSEEEDQPNQDKCDQNDGPIFEPYAEKLKKLYKKLSFLQPDKTEARIKRQINDLIDSLSTTSVVSNYSRSSSTSTRINSNPKQTGQFVSHDFYRAILKSKTDWTVINMYCTMEHPNYASITYNSVDEDISVNLPDNITLSTKDKGAYVLNIDDTMTAEISAELIAMQSIMCPICMEKTYTNIFIKYLYENSSAVPIGEKLLECKDTYKKVFTIDYQGICFRNEEFLTENPCQEHKIISQFKSYCMNRDLSGKVFWDENMFNQRLAHAQSKCEEVIQHGPKESPTYEFRNNNYEYFSNRYMLPYLTPRLYLSDQMPKITKKNLVYVTKRILNSLISVKSLENIFECLSPGDDIDPNKSLILHNASAANWEKEEPAAPPAHVEEVMEETNKNFENEGAAAIDAMVRWNERKKNCEELWTILRSGQIPKYTYPVLEKVVEEKFDLEEIKQPIVYEDKGVNTDPDPLVDKLCPGSDDSEENQFYSSNMYDTGKAPKSYNSSSVDVKIVNSTDSRKKADEKDERKHSKHSKQETEPIMDLIYINYKRSFQSHENLFGYEANDVFEDEIEDNIDEEVGTISSLNSSIYEPNMIYSRSIPHSMIVLRSEENVFPEESNSDMVHREIETSVDHRTVVHRITDGPPVTKNESSEFTRHSSAEFEETEDEGSDDESDYDNLIAELTSFPHKKSSSMMVNNPPMSKIKSKEDVTKLSSGLLCNEEIEFSESKKPREINPSLYVFRSNDSLSIEGYTVSVQDVAAQTLQGPDMETQTECIQ